MLIGHSVSPATEGTYMNTMSAHDASAIVTDLRDSGIQSWVMGGWGIDALLARTTRPHHDLDLLVHVADLPALAGWMRANGFEWAYDWEEARTFHQGGQELSTAFVATHTDGRELDIHAVNIDHNGQCVLATDDPWQLPPDTLLAPGRSAVCAFGACRAPHKLRCILATNCQRTISKISRHSGTRTATRGADVNVFRPETNAGPKGSGKAGERMRRCRRDEQRSLGCRDCRAL